MSEPLAKIENISQSTIRFSFLDANFRFAPFERLHFLPFLNPPTRRNWRNRNGGRRSRKSEKEPLPHACSGFDRSASLYGWGVETAGPYHRHIWFRQEKSNRGKPAFLFVSTFMNTSFFAKPKPFQRKKIKIVTIGKLVIEKRNVLWNELCYSF